VAAARPVRQPGGTRPSHRARPFRRRNRSQAHRARPTPSSASPSQPVRRRRWSR
jgi:hypothetical protein